ncbi:MAG: DUF2062 domain-containing protein [Vicinamibacterales bacterium]
MIKATREMLQRWAETLLHIDDTPERTARAYALGIFFGFSPFLGLHTVLAVTLAFALRLNRVAVLLGVYSNLPWIIAPYYTAATIGGAMLTRSDLPLGFRDRLGEVMHSSFTDASLWRRISSMLEPLLWPYAVGSTIGAVLLSLLAYPIALAFVRTRRRHKAQHHP